jgi:hypothetical protein
MTKRVIDLRSPNSDPDGLFDNLCQQIDQQGHRNQKGIFGII